MVGCGIRYSEISAGVPYTSAITPADPGVGEGFDQLSRRGRRFFRAFDDDGTPRRQRGGQLAHDLVDREVPRRESGHRADRQLEGLLLYVAGAGRNDLPVGAGSFAGEPVDDVGGVENFDFGLRHRFALFLRHDGGDGIGAFAQQRRRFAHQVGALVRGGVAPDGKSALGGGQRQIEILCGGVRHLTDYFVGGGVGDRQGFPGQRVAPLSIDIQLSIRIHCCLLFAECQGPMSFAMRRA